MINFRPLILLNPVIPQQQEVWPQEPAKAPQTSTTLQPATTVGPYPANKNQQLVAPVPQPFPSGIQIQQETNLPFQRLIQAPSFQIEGIAYDALDQARKTLGFTRAPGFGIDMAKASILLDAKTRKSDLDENLLTLVQLPDAAPDDDQHDPRKILDPQRLYLQLAKGTPLHADFEIQNSLLFWKKIHVEQSRYRQEQELWQCPAVGLFVAPTVFDTNPVTFMSHLIHVENNFVRTPIAPNSTQTQWTFAPQVDQNDIAISVDPGAIGTVIAPITDKLTNAFSRSQLATPTQRTPIAAPHVLLQAIDFANRRYGFENQDLDQKIRILGNKGFPVNQGMLPYDLPYLDPALNIPGVPTTEDPRRLVDSNHFGLRVLDLAPLLNYYRKAPLVYGNSSADLGPLDLGIRYFFAPPDQLDPANQFGSDSFRSLPTEYWIDPMRSFGQLLLDLVDEGDVTADWKALNIDQIGANQTQVVAQIQGLSKTSVRHVTKASLYSALDIPSDIFPQLTDIHFISSPRMQTPNQAKVRMPLAVIKNDVTQRTRFPSLSVRAEGVEMDGDFFAIPETLQSPLGSATVVRNLKLTASSIIFENANTGLLLEFPQGMMLEMDRLMMGHGYAKYIDYIADFPKKAEKVPPYLQDPNPGHARDFRVDQPIVFAPVLRFQLRVNRGTAQEQILQGELRNFEFRPEFFTLRQEVLDGLTHAGDVMAAETLMTKILQNAADQNLIDALFQSVRLQNERKVDYAFVRYLDRYADLLIEGQNVFPIVNFDLRNTPGNIIRTQVDARRQLDMPLSFRVATQEGEFRGSYHLRAGTPDDLSSFLPSMQINPLTGQLTMDPAFGLRTAQSFLGQSSPTDFLDGMAAFISSQKILRFANLQEPQRSKCLALVQDLEKRGYRWGGEEARNKDILQRFFLDTSSHFRESKPPEKASFIQLVYSIIEKKNSLFK